MKKEVVIGAIYRWGIYPALVLLRTMQDDELYEECAVIKSAIDEVIAGREWLYDTSVDDCSLSVSYRKLFKGRFVIQQNMPVYISDFKKFVLQTH